MDKEQLKAREARVIELAVAFCNEHLDEECVDLCTKLIQKLGRKRTCPMQSGRLEIWAAASVYAICSINFMFSKDSRLHTSPAEICDYFGTSSSTVGQKAKTIRDLLNIDVFDPNFSIKDIADKNPFRSFIVKDGFIFFE